MASNPGILTEWPWTCLGNYKYTVLAPFAIQSTYQYLTAGTDTQRNLANFLVLPLLLSRALHNLIWISLSRYRTAKGSNRIVDKTIEFDQVDREANWDDQIILNGLLLYIGQIYIDTRNLPLWRTDGVIWTFVIHAGPVEFIYYWLHRALHHHFLYSRYHSHHHSSIVTEPITSVIHPFAEHIAYYALFAIPILGILLSGMSSVAAIGLYVTFIDLMNNMGHCNFEHVPKFIFSIFPPLKYIMYTPSYHSLHHTQFRTNYCLFMPFYDYVYGTMDKSSDSLYEKSIAREAEGCDVVHLTHLTTPESIYHLRFGFAHFAAQPYESKWYLILMWPLTLWSTVNNWLYGRRFVLERNVFKNLKLQTWCIPKYTIQYQMNWKMEMINNMIEDAILSMEKKGTKVVSLGLLNQGHELNRNGEVFVRKHPKLKVKVVDGSSLASAIVLNTIPKEATQVLIRGNLTKVAYAVALALCKGGIQVFTLHEDEYKKIKEKMRADDKESHCKLMLFRKHETSLPKIWLVGDGLTKDEQLMAPKGTTFIPLSQIPHDRIRKDCIYRTTPAMLAPKHLQNLDSCENWLPRRAMSASRIAGILHAAEEWNVDECGDNMLDIGRTWEACLKHGFRPLSDE